MFNMKSGIAVATAAAALFTMGVAAPVAQAADGTVKCQGANSCKGTSECKSAAHACKGQNSCKGQGWVSKGSEKDCTAAGGTVAK
jgi:hypothetical protein